MIIFHNLTLKILSLISAAGIWFYASTDVKVVETVEIPVEFSMPDGFVLLSVTSQKLLVEIEGKKREIMFFLRRNPVYRVKIERGIKDYITPDRDNIKIPGWLNIKIRRIISPSRIYIWCEREKERSVKVWTPVGVRAVPDIVKIKGAASVVSRISFIRPSSIPKEDGYAKLRLPEGVVESIPPEVKIIHEGSRH